MSNIKIPLKAKVKVYWHYLIDDYSREEIANIKSSFATKYNIPISNISVVPVACKQTEDGKTVEISDIQIDNIMDVSYQRILMKQWIENEKRVVDFDKIIELDDKINKLLEVNESNISQRKYIVKNLKINNFLCFDNDVNVDFELLNKIVVINSVPGNYGGKSSFINAIEFLLFGKCEKTTRNEDVFNLYSEHNDVIVSGELIIDSENFYIERNFTRSKKKSEGYNISTKTAYYQIMPDGSKQELDNEAKKELKDELKKDLKEEHTGRTSAKIIEAIGDNDDFQTVILCSSRNLEELIDTKPTARGLLLTKFIGLLPIQQKEDQVRKLFNEFSKSMKANHYDINNLRTDIENKNNQIKENNNNIITYNTQKEELKTATDILNNQKDEILKNKKNIDNEVLSVDVVQLQKYIKDNTDKGITTKAIHDNIIAELKEIGEVKFDDTIYASLTKQDKEISIKISNNDNELKRLNKEIEGFKTSQLCPILKTKCDKIDKEKQIKENNEKIDKINKEKEENNKELKTIQDKITALDKTKTIYNDKLQQELKRDKLSVELQDLRIKITEKKELLAKYNLNLESIESNKKLEVELMSVNNKITINNHQNEELIKKIQICNSNISQLGKEIINNEKIIEEINKEEEIEKLFKLYIEIIGKKGISKIVLRTAVPLINSEIHRLLDDVCDFELELYMNEKNDVEFLLIRDGIEKDLKMGSGFEKTVSSLALRCVLGRVSCLPRPNFIIFDEVLGSACAENLDNMRSLFEKIQDYFDTIFIITHNEIVKDWANHILTFNKVNNITNILTSNVKNDIKDIIRDKVSLVLPEINKPKEVKIETSSKIKDGGEDKTQKQHVTKKSNNNNNVPKQESLF